MSDLGIIEHKSEYKNTQTYSREGAKSANPHQLRKKKERNMLRPCCKEQSYGYHVIWPAYSCFFQFVCVMAIYKQIVANLDFARFSITIEHSTHKFYFADCVYH
eukprot:490030_1